MTQKLTPSGRISKQLRYVCKECGKEFFKYASQVTVSEPFCTGACRDEYRRETVLATCQSCGAEIKSNPSRQAKGQDICCSRKCYGDLRRETPETFWASVNRSSGPDNCWPWQRKLTKTGYGKATLPGGTRSSISAHRVAWILTNGPIASPKIMVRHDCNNPSCCNPAHLLLGSQLENKQDSMEANRHAHGESHAKAMLTEAQVREIRSKTDPNNLTPEIKRVLGAEYGVSSGTIYAVVKNLTWRHLL